MVLERGGGEDRLEGRAGLVGIGDGAVADAVLRRSPQSPRSFGLKVGHVGERQDLAGARVEHDRGAGRRLRVGHAGRQLALGDRLDAASSVSSTRLPCVGCVGERRAHELAAARVALDGERTRLAADLAVEAALEPSSPCESTPTKPSTCAASAPCG